MGLPLLVSFYKIVGIRLCIEGSQFIGQYKSLYHFGPSVVTERMNHAKFCTILGSPS